MRMITSAQIQAPAVATANVTNVLRPMGNGALYASLAHRLTQPRRYGRLMTYREVWRRDAQCLAILGRSFRTQ